MILGAVITCVFTAANIYLGLKVGLTFASSIPAAVISMVVLRLFGGASVLENNIVQTQASAAGTLSAIIFVIPGLVMVGYWHGFPWFETAGLCAAGGILGVMFTIPLRRAMIIEAGLPFPEGVAAAEVLKVGQDAASSGARDLAVGGILAGALSLLSSGFGILADAVSCVFTVGPAIFKLGTGLSLALVGAGYLMGIAAGIAIIVGFVISWGIAVPYLTAITPLPAATGLADFAQSLWRTQVRFMGAGTIGIAAVWTLLTLAPSIARGLRQVAAVSRASGAAAGVERTDRDMSARQIVVVTLLSMAGLLVVFLAFLGVRQFGLAVLATLWATAIGLLVASACGYMAGIVGSSSSPISGVGIVAVVLTSLGLAAMPSGVTAIGIPVALFVTSAVVAAGTISNDNLQDLKTGYLVGATPASQQIALIVGCIVGAMIIPPLLDLLYQAYGFPGALPRAGMDPNLALAAPQATLISSLAKGILGHETNWTMIGIGGAIGAALIVVDLVLKAATRALRLPVLAVGIGIYLPPTVSATLVIGAVLGWIIKRCMAKYPQKSQADADQRGVLVASGFIVGESLVGVVLAGIIAFVGKQDALILVGPAFAPIASALGSIAFLAACVVFARMVIKRAASPNSGTV